MANARPAIVLSANTAWFITNFCGGLVRGLRAAGFNPVAVAPGDPATAGAMRALGLEHFEVLIERSGINPIADFRLFREYRRLLRDLRPAAYLGFTIKPNVYGSLAAELAGVPAIPNVSGIGNAFMWGGPVQQVVRWLSRLAFRRARVVFFQNADDCRFFTERRIVRPGQARILPGIGVDLAWFAPAESSSGAAPTFLLVCRLVRDKGVFEYLEAARSLRSLLPNARFQILGPIDDDHRTAISQSDVDGWVDEGVIEYLGATDDVRPFIAASTAVVLPSYREGLPRSLLEAAAMARPLIATDVPGCRDVVEEGVNGYLCKPRDADSLAAAMSRLAQLPDSKLKAMGEAARRGVQDRFSDELVVRAYLDALAGLER